jgi:cell wall-associated NlpC family hydrolase
MTTTQLITALRAAESRRGLPYVWGAAGPAAFDCSGLVQWAFAQAGISLPRTSFAQYGVGSPVASSQVQAGDLVFFDTAGGGASHDGIAVSATEAVSATTHGVMTHPIFSGYWGSHFVGARRIA